MTKYEKIAVNRKFKFRAIVIGWVFLLLSPAAPPCLLFAGMAFAAAGIFHFAAESATDD